MATVLVVDDSPVDRRLAGALLEKQFECTVEYAADGKEALEQIARHYPDVVLTDLQMPQMNGLELVAAVKKDFPLVPVILMTARGSEDIAAEALRQGAASYVPKHNLAEDLLPTVHRILLGSYEDRGHSRLMHHLESSDSTFVLGNDPALIKELVNHLQQMLRCLPLSDETERLRVGVAVEEALLNACYHGNLEVPKARTNADRSAQEQLAQQRLLELPYCNRRIFVTATFSRTQVKFVIRDQGPGFDTAGLPAGRDLPKDEGGVGRGLSLMRTIMDEVIYNQTGNEVTLIKHASQNTLSEGEGI